MTIEKKEKTLAELEQDAITLAKQDKTLTDEIDALTETRTKVRKERRAVEGKITTMHINAKV
jgi:predicted  nucleic acid-binding Zn-ribbon protein